jgi:hypothetical protein
MKQVVYENSTLVFVNVAGNACATGISAIRMQRVVCVVYAQATHRLRSKSSRGDSESGFLAMKKFFDTNSLWLAAISPNRLSGESQPVRFGQCDLL